MDEKSRLLMFAKTIEPATIVLVDPPFAYGRQMVIEFADGTRKRVPYDAERVEAQRRRAREASCGTSS